MAFATRSDLIVYQPDIGDMGLSTAQQDAYVTQAIADVQRDIRNRWWSVYQANKVRDRSYIGSVEMENSKLTDSQLIDASNGIEPTGSINLTNGINYDIIYSIPLRRIVYLVVCLYIERNYYGKSK